MVIFVDIKTLNPVFIEIFCERSIEWTLLLELWFLVTYANDLLTSGTFASAWWIKNKQIHFATWLRFLNQRAITLKKIKKPTELMICKSPIHVDAFHQNLLTSGTFTSAWWIINKQIHIPTCFRFFQSKGHNPKKNKQTNSSYWHANLLFMLMLCTKICQLVLHTFG